MKNKLKALDMHYPLSLGIPWIYTFRNTTRYDVLADGHITQSTFKS